jgi:hypothetical protein
LRGLRVLDFQAKLLGRAADICGGWSVLCGRLGVDGESLRLWLDAKARLPQGVFLQAADIVLEDDMARAAQDRRAAPRVAVVQPDTQPAATDIR